MTAVNASAWIPPCYSSTGGLSFNRYHFSLLVRRALGISFIRTGARQQNETCPRKFVTGEARGKRCGAFLDPRLFHASDGCKAIRYQRHHGVARALTKVFRRAEYQVQLERQVLGCADRPADLYIPDWLENRALAVDVTAVAAHRGEGKEPRAKVVGALVAKAERKKEKRYRKSHPGFRSANVVYSLCHIILREYGQESEGSAQVSRSHDCGSRTNLTTSGSSANCAADCFSGDEASGRCNKCNTGSTRV